MKKILQYSVGEKFELFLLIKRATKAIATNGKPYLTLNLQDKSGELEARVWDVSEQGITSFIAGNIVKVQGEIQSYRGKNQIRINKVRLKHEQENISVEDLIMSAPLTRAELIKQINEVIEQMTNLDLQKIVRHLVNKYNNEFLTFPAATKNHHEFFSGLAYHVVSMLKIGKALSDIYPSINQDLLYAGIILHDLGKIKELSGPIVTSYTVQGNLLGHITLMCNEVACVATELKINSESVLLLQHMILAHHGKGEWGSPKEPLIREAEILHIIDNIDARINMIDRALEYLEPGEFSQRVFALEDRSFYKPDTNS